MKRLLLLLPLFALAASEPVFINLTWEFPAPDYAEYPDADSFILYTSQNPKLPLDQWMQVATIPGTDRQFRIAVLKQRQFYYLVASNFWGISVPSNIAYTPNNGNPDKLKISK